MYCIVEQRMGTNSEDVKDPFSPPWFNVSIPIVYGSAYKKTFCLTNRANDVVPVYIYINIIQFLLCCDVLHLVFIGSLVWFQNADYVSLHRIWALYLYPFPPNETNQKEVDLVTIGFDITLICVDLRNFWIRVEPASDKDDIRTFQHL